MYAYSLLMDAKSAGDKIIVFCAFGKPMHLFQRFCVENKGMLNSEFLSYDGTLTINERTEVIDRFNKSDESDIVGR